MIRFPYDLWCKPLLSMKKGNMKGSEAVLRPESCDAQRECPLSRINRQAPQESRDVDDRRALGCVETVGKLYSPSFPGFSSLIV